MSSNGKNAANQGIKGMLGAVLEALSFGGDPAVYGALYSYGMHGLGGEYACMWSLSRYMDTAPQEKIKDDWDEMEKSIIASAPKNQLAPELLRTITVVTDPNTTAEKTISTAVSKGTGIAITCREGYSEADKSILLEMTCAGAEYDPFAVPEDDDVHLGITILRRVAKERSSEYRNNANKITIKL